MDGLHRNLVFKALTDSKEDKNMLSLMFNALNILLVDMTRNCKDSIDEFELGYLRRVGNLCQGKGTFPDPVFSGSYICGRRLNYPVWRYSRNANGAVESDASRV